MRHAFASTDSSIVTLPHSFSPHSSSCSSLMRATLEHGRFVDGRVHGATQPNTNTASYDMANDAPDW